MVWVHGLDKAGGQNYGFAEASNLTTRFSAVQGLIQGLRKALVQWLGQRLGLRLAKSAGAVHDAPVEAPGQPTRGLHGVKVRPRRMKIEG